MRGPDKGPPQSLETTAFSKLVILLWRMLESISALTCGSMPTSPPHLHPYLPRISWSMATKARALQTCNSHSTFFQNTNRGRGGTTLSYNGSVLGAHTQSRAGFPPVHEDSALHCRGCPGQSPPSSFPCSSVACKKKRSWPWFPLSSFV